MANAQVVTELVIDSSGAVEGERKYTDAMAGAQVAQERQIAGITKINAAMNGQMTVFNGATMGMSRLTAAYQKITASVDPVAKATQLLQKQYATLDTIVQRGVADEEAATALREELYKKQALALDSVQAAQLRVNLGIVGEEAELDELAVAAARAGAALESVALKTTALAEKSLLGLREQFVGLGKSILLPIAAIATVDGAIDAMKEQIERLDAAGKLSQSLGLSTESLSELQHAAQMADVSSDQLSTGLRQLAKNALDVAQGTKGGPALAFDQLGISVKTASGQLKPTNVLFDQAAQKLSTMANSANKTALAQQLFGRSGAALIPLLNEGRDGLKEMADESDRLGLTISSKAASGAAEFADQLKLLQDRFDGLASRIVQNTLPALEGAVTSLSALFAEAGDGGPILGLLEGGLRDISSFIVQMTGAVQQAVDVFEGLNVALYQISQGKSPGWQAEAWFNSAAKDGAAADAKAKAILDGTYVAPTSTDGNSAPRPGSSPPISTTAKGLDAYQRALQSAKADTANLVAQQQALGQTAFQASKLEEQQKLINAATQKGIALSPDQLQAIDLASTQYAQQKAILDSLTVVYQTGQQASEDFLSTMKSDLLSGTSLWGSLGDAASKALDDISNKALQMASDGIWNMIFGGLTGSSGSSSGGLLGSILGVFGIGGGASASGAELVGTGSSYATGGLIRGPGTGTSDSILARVSSGEFVMNAASTRAYLPQLHAMNSMPAFARGGPVTPMPANTNYANDDGGSVTIAPSYHFTGTSLTEAQIKRIMADNNRQLVAAVPGIVVNARRRGVPGMS